MRIMTGSAGCIGSDPRSDQAAICFKPPKGLKDQSVNNPAKTPAAMGISDANPCFVTGIGVSGKFNTPDFVVDIVYGKLYKKRGHPKEMPLFNGNGFYFLPPPLPAPPEPEPLLPDPEPLPELLRDPPLPDPEPLPIPLPGLKLCGFCS